MLPKKRPPTHPGEMLVEEFLKPLGLSRRELAARLGWPQERLDEILENRGQVNTESAKALGEALGTGPEFWLDLQQRRNLWGSK